MEIENEKWKMKNGKSFPLLLPFSPSPLVLI
jgi:hypothetical protein